MRFRDEQERLVAEQAVLGLRAVREAAAKAQWGRGLEVVELAVLEQGRKQQQQVLEAAMREASQKRTRHAAASGAGAGPRRSGPLDGR